MPVQMVSCSLNTSLERISLHLFSLSRCLLTLNANSRYFVVNEFSLYLPLNDVMDAIRRFATTATLGASTDVACTILRFEPCLTPDYLVVNGIRSLEQHRTRMWTLFAASLHLLTSRRLPAASNLRTIQVAQCTPTLLATTC